MTERDLIIGCSNGERDCQRQLYEIYSAKMMAVCFRYTGNMDIANDLLHDGFVQLFTHISDYRFTGSFEGWVRRIFVTASLNYLRREKRISGADIDEMVNIGDADENSIIDKISDKELIETLNKLPNGYRTVLNMYAIEGYSHKEIGATLGIGESSSRSQFLRAKQMLKKMLKV